MYIEFSLTFLHFYREAFVIVENMKAEGYKPDFITMNTLLHVCATNGDVESAERVFKEISENSPIRPDIMTYNHLLFAYAEAHKHYSHTYKSDEMLKYVNFLYNFFILFFFFFYFFFFFIFALYFCFYC